ncbi:hypothetical protein F4811DRAFT_305522 [Daldinia bambusicola]|nr:hypothetical protein F4811DRAFT_305522 [Daldinia bambusicola]
MLRVNAIIRRDRGTKGPTKMVSIYAFLRYLIVIIYMSVMSCIYTCCGGYFISFLRRRNKSWIYLLLIRNGYLASSLPHIRGISNISAQVFFFFFFFFLKKKKKLGERMYLKVR